MGMSSVVQCVEEEKMRSMEEYEEQEEACGQEVVDRRQRMEEKKEEEARRLPQTRRTPKPAGGLRDRRSAQLPLSSSYYSSSQLPVST